MKTIRNGSRFTTATKMATLKASKAKYNKGRSIGAIAADFGVAGATLRGWRRVAGLSQAQPAGLKAHQAAQTAIKAYNTPTIESYTTKTGDTAQCIMHRGRRYI